MANKIANPSTSDFKQSATATAQENSNNQVQPEQKNLNQMGMENQNQNGATQDNLPLKFQIPPEELLLIQQKKKLQLDALRYKILSQQYQIEKLKAKLLKEKILNKVQLETLKKTALLQKAKLNQMMVANIKVYGRVGKIVITPNLALKDGQLVGENSVIIVKDKKIIVKNKKDKVELVVATYTTNPLNIEKQVSTSLKTAQKPLQTFQLKSGEKFVK